MNKKKILSILALPNLLFLFAPFAVSSVISEIVPVITLPVLLILLNFIFLSFILLKKGIVFREVEKKIILIFILPIIASTFNVIVTLLTEESPFFADYASSHMFNRLFLVIANITILLGLIRITSGKSYVQKFTLIRKYYYGLIIMAFVGVWQFISYFTAIPFLNLETRSHIHSVAEGTTFLISTRLTSLSNEPSFLAPLMIDLMILSLLFAKKKNYQFIIALFVLIFSFSGGGYVNLFFLFLAFIWIYGKYKEIRIKKKYLLLGVFFALIFVLSAVSNLEFMNELFSPILGRGAELYTTHSSRNWMIVRTFTRVLEGSFLNSLFGYGPNSILFLRLTEALPNGRMFHVTTNNIFADAVFELGYFGFLMYLYFFWKLFSISLNSLKNNKYKFVGCLMTVHLFLSSMYRGDYMTSRFWIIVFIIMTLGKIEINVVEEEKLDSEVRKE